MTDISRDSYDPTKDYLGVYLQQGRPILDADWNEAQDITRAALAEIRRTALGDGSPDSGFQITACNEPLPVPPLLGANPGFASFIALPGPEADAFAHLGSVSSTSPANVRLAEDRPYRDRPYLRVSGQRTTTQILRDITPHTWPADADVIVIWLRTEAAALTVEELNQVVISVTDTSGSTGSWKPAAPAMFAQIHNLLKHREWLPLVIELDDLPRILSTDLPPITRGKPYNVDVEIGGFTPPVMIETLPEWLEWDPSGSVLRTKEGSATPRDLPDKVTLKFILTGQLRNSTLPATIHQDLVVQVIDNTTTQRNGDSYRAPWRGAPPLALLSKPPYPDFALIAEQGGLLAISLPGRANGEMNWDLGRLSIYSERTHGEMVRTDAVVRGGDADRNRATLVQLWTSANQSTAPDLDSFVADLDPKDRMALLYDPESNLLNQSILGPKSGTLFTAGHRVRNMYDDLLSTRSPDWTRQLSARRDPISRKSPKLVTYLDTWCETVTAADNPRLAEPALGGTDTSTRSELRSMVRIGRDVPTGGGTGSGTLETSGTYSGAAPAVLRVEIDNAGTFGAATFRWSTTNGSAVRAIQTLDDDGTGSRLTLGDAGCFSARDHVVVRLDGTESVHTIDRVDHAGIVVTPRVAPPQVPRPPASVQGWDEVGVTITASSDPTLSIPIPLGATGVTLRFGIGFFLQGDYWAFRAGPQGRRLLFSPPTGIRHWYTKLATITASGFDPLVIKDDRLQIKSSVPTNQEEQDEDRR
jgi:hypothetical protein